jgi:hypothetical protein
MVSAEKVRALAIIEADYRELLMKTATIRTRRPGEEEDKQQKDYELLQKEKEADIARLLSPEEYAEYELRSSALASRLQEHLERFQPTEAEYKTLFAIQKTFDAKLKDANLSGEARDALQREMTAQVVAALGSDRAQDYEEIQHEEDQTARVVARLGLPARVATQVRSLQKEYVQRGTTVRSDAQLLPAERTAQLAALAQEARARLSAALGVEGFEAYSDLKGDWLRALEAK